mgnify:CR=1 FL=1
MYFQALGTSFGFLMHCCLEQKLSVNKFFLPSEGASTSWAICQRVLYQTSAIQRSALSFLISCKHNGFSYDTILVLNGLNYPTLNPSFNYKFYNRPHKLLKIEDVILLVS